MKANAPEKLYVDVQDNFSDSMLYGFIAKGSDEDIEYTRTDAFIEKACNYLFSHMGLSVTFFDDDIVEDIERSEFIKKFRIAMEDKL
jgi:hypothetical protein